MAWDKLGWVNAALRSWADRCPDDVQVILKTQGEDKKLIVVNHSRGFEFEVRVSPR